MLDLLCLYLVNVMRPVFEDSKSSSSSATARDKDDDDDEEEEDELEGIDAGEQVVSSTVSATSEPGEPTSGRGRKKRNSKVDTREASHRGHNHSRPRPHVRFKDIELLDPNGPKLIVGMRRWFVLYQIIGQLNWMGKPLYLSIIYKALLTPTCVYILWRDFLEPVTETINLMDHFKNPIFVFISLSAMLTMLLHAILTIYNNLFNLCPMFKVLTTERLCFIREEVQHIVGNKTMPTMMLFFATNCLLFRLCVARNLEDFVHQFDIIQFLVDFFAVLWLGNHFIGISYIDFYIRVCFGMWILAMKTNLEYRFAYLQKHQRVHSRRARAGHVSLAPSQQERTSAGRSESALGSRSPEEYSLATEGTTAGTMQQPIGRHPNTCPGVDGTWSSRVSETDRRLLSCSSSFSMADHMTLADFKAKYKIDTLDEIQRNLNTMDDHLEVSREFQNSSLVLITLSAFLTNGALLLLAYNLLANQKNYFHGVLIVLLSASYTICIFLCYIGDSWISYALESFVQTVEDEYFLQSGGGGDGANEDADVDANNQEADDDQKSTLPRLLGDETISNSHEHMMQQEQQRRQQQQKVLPCEWSQHSTGGPVRPSIGHAATDQSDAGSEPAPTGHLAVAQSYQLFMIKKRDVLFCREFLHQFQNHLATPWSKLTVKIQLHMLGTFVTLIAAQIIFDREH